MSNSVTKSESEKQPFSFLLALWWGYILSAVYILYGGVSIILSFLDRNYKGMSGPLIFLALGMLLLFFAFAFRDRKKFGWYGQVVLNCGVVLYCVFTLKQYGAAVLLVLAALSLAMYFAPSTRGCFPSRR